MAAETGPHVLIVPGTTYVLFDLPASVGMAAELKRCGFTSRYGTIWAGTKDDLHRAKLPPDCYPPGHPALWPDDWSSLDALREAPTAAPKRRRPPGMRLPPGA